MTKRNMGILLVKEENETEEKMMERIKLMLCDYFNIYEEPDSNPDIEICGSDDPFEMECIINEWNNWVFNALRTTPQIIINALENAEKEKKDPVMVITQLDAGNAADRLLNALRFLAGDITDDYTVFLNSRDQLKTYMRPEDKKYFLDHLEEAY